MFARKACHTCIVYKVLITNTLVCLFNVNMWVRGVLSEALLACPHTGVFGGKLHPCLAGSVMVISRSSICEMSAKAF